MKNILLSNRVSRWLIKSIRNIWFPVKIKEADRLAVSIEISSICNALCVFCNYRFGYRKKQLMTLDDFEKIAKVSAHQKVMT